MWCFLNPSPPRVYPRVCGGSCHLLNPATRQIGLSPRVRGKPPPPGRRAGLTRSIPACAGEARMSLMTM